MGFPGMGFPHAPGTMDDLFLAVPLSEILSISPGFTAPVPLTLLDAIAASGWLAASSAIAEDPTAVVVELAVLVVQPGTGCWWCRSDGRLVEAAPITDGDLALGEGLSALRATARNRSGIRAVELAGVVIDTSTARRKAILIYRAQAETVSGAAGSWVSPASVAQVTRDPLSSVVLQGLAQ